MLAINIGVGAIMVGMTLVSIPLMDRAGRRTLHLWGLGGMFIFSIFITISLLVMVTSFFYILQLFSVLYIFSKMKKTHSMCRNWLNGSAMWPWSPHWPLCYFSPWAPAPFLGWSRRSFSVKDRVRQPCLLRYLSTGWPISLSAYSSCLSRYKHLSSFLPTNE